MIVTPVFFLLSFEGYKLLLLVSFPSPSRSHSASRYPMSTRDYVRYELNQAWPLPSKPMSMILRVNSKCLLCTSQKQSASWEKNCGYKMAP